MFTHWELSKPKMISDGVRDISVVPIKDILRIQLTIDSDALGNIALLMLGSETGLPMKLRYETRADSKVHGELPLALSLARSTKPTLKINGDVVTNTGRKALTMTYFMVGEQGIPLNPALTVTPGKSVKLPVGVDISTAKIAVPPEAVYADGVSLLKDFDIMGGGLITEVTVTNLLGNDEELGGDLDYVEVKITYLVDEGGATMEYPLERFRLSSWGTHGSEIKIPFIKPRQSRERFRIEGTAYYGNQQSSHTIAPMVVDDLVIKIDEQFLGN
ncbi:hypothetical protein THIOM_000173 [Candidatus Thiomargarita nelsonii]|uniref:Uncharacterized protein n=1 Tax=Candidatus Thiomargarita nelsonii TaxID=1003181 RepID=A0A176S790_9GAMM|nr:hypothetical protein THIOM_000173 [Candidatus Thiomargarita nelsonii]